MSASGGAGTGGSPIEILLLKAGEWSFGVDRGHVLFASTPGPASRLAVRGAKVVLQADAGEGLVTFLPAGVPWRIEVPDGGADVTALTVPAELVLELCGSSAGPWRTAVSERHVRIADAATWLIGASDESAGRELVSRLLTRLTARSFGDFACRADDSWLPAAALARIGSLVTSMPAVGGLSVPALAGDAGLGVSAFSRAFRGSTGMTPGEYLIRARMDQVALLLDSTDLPVAAIAARTGLSGVGHLTQQFSQRFGVTPGRYRSAGRSARFAI